MTPNLILMAGLPASGKSSFAAYASAALDIPVIEKDKIKEGLFDTVGFRTHDEKTQLDISATETMIRRASGILDRGGSVILDSNFENRNIASLEKLVSEHPCNVVTVRFCGDIRVIYERFEKRDKDPSRHPGHVNVSSYPDAGDGRNGSSRKTFESFRDDFRSRGTMDFSMGRLIRVDATDFSALSYPDILSELRRAMV